MHRAALRLSSLLLLSLSGVSAGAPRPVVEKTLPNGLTVLVAEDHALPLVTVEYAVRSGSMIETPEDNGLSHLYEHMFFEANAAIPDAEACLRKLRELGMVYNATTDTERVNYYFTTTTDHLDDALAFLHEAVVSPLFARAELDRERVVVTDEMDLAEAQPAFHLERAVDHALWWRYPWHKDPLGSRSVVLHATPDQMRSLEHRYYLPSSSAIVVTGDVRPGDVIDRVAARFASWQEKPAEGVAPPDENPPLARSSVVVVEQPVSTVSVTLAWQGPSSVGDGVPWTYPADVLTFALAEPASPFQRALVDSGACVRASFAWLTQRHTGPITVELEARPERADRCVSLALAQLHDLARDPNDALSPVEIARAVKRAELENALDREKPSQYAHALSFWWATAGLDYFRDYLAHLRQVTPSDVPRFLERWVVGKPLVLGALVSPAMRKRQHLDRAHFEKLLAHEAPTPPSVTR